MSEPKADHAAAKINAELWGLVEDGPLCAVDNKNLSAAYLEAREAIAYLLDIALPLESDAERFRHITNTFREG